MTELQRVLSAGRCLHPLDWTPLLVAAAVFWAALG